MCINLRLYLQEVYMMVGALLNIEALLNLEAGIKYSLNNIED
jgi:hypothetical protein